MNVLTLIKNKKAIRIYKDKKISSKMLSQIVEAGVWGPSLLAVGFQPWKFVVITNEDVIKNMATILLKKSETIGIGGSRVLRMSANTILKAKVAIVVYNSCCVSNFVKRFEEVYMEIAHCAEISAIAAAIQNISLTAESFKIGSCWLDAPLFCEKEINGLLKKSDKLVAILTLGYPDNKGKRSPRKPLAETVEYIK